MPDKMADARGLVRSVLERFIEDGYEDLLDELRDTLAESEEFEYEDSWGDTEINYDLINEYADEVKDQADKLVKIMLKDMRAW